MHLTLKPFTRSSRRPLMIGVLILCSIAGALVLGMLRYNSHHKILSGPVERVNASSQNKPDKINTIDSVRLTITRTGIIPAEVEVKEGNFFSKLIH
jgi:hypothetical protein